MRIETYTVVNNIINIRIIVTVSAKTDHVPTKTEITFIAQEHSYTQ